MFNIYWDEKNNIPILSNDVSQSYSLYHPRPVYFEELDVLGFNSYWDYPRVEEPLLWAIGRSYYYMGIEVAIVKGGSLAEEPIVEIIHAGRLQPISTAKLIEKNRSRLTILENEAKQHISTEYAKHRENSVLAVAFSGGKDSQVILELVSQVIPPDEYYVIYTDTGMELPETRDFVDSVFRSYKEQYPPFQYAIATQINDIGFNWRQFGPPSRLHRWCCTVAKSAPFYVKLSQLIKGQRTVVFEGVRRGESHARSGYERIAASVKHDLVTNCRPIISWNDTEVYLYLISKSVRLNPAYRKGLTRVGCSLCPFSSDWSELMIKKTYSDINTKFFNEIRRVFEFNGIQDLDKQEIYIAQGKWKVRGGEKNLPENGSMISFSSVAGTKRVAIKSPKSSFLNWIKVFRYHISSYNDNGMTLEVSVGKEIAGYEVVFHEDLIIVKYANGNPLAIDRDFTKVLMKITYCVGCHACFVECPVGAISFNPMIIIDEQKCIHCLRCISSIEKGCLIAASRSINLGDKDMINSNMNVDRYSTFGLREQWLKAFICNPNEWETGLGNKQVIALKRWLTEAELINSKMVCTELASIITDLPIEEIWGVVWTNLAYNSGIVTWYQKVPYQNWTRSDLFDELKKTLPVYSDGTLNNAFSALLNLMDNSDTISNKFGQGSLGKKGKSIVTIFKRPNNSVSNATLIYALYKYATAYNAVHTTVSELYASHTHHTPYHLFGVNSETLQRQLLSLQEHKSRLLRVEFNANLDNIFLSKDHTALSALKAYLEA